MSLESAGFSFYVIKTIEECIISMKGGGEVYRLMKGIEG